MSPRKSLVFKAPYRWVVKRIRVFNPLALPKPVFRIRRYTSLKLFLLGTCLTYLAIGLYFIVLPIYLKRVIRISDAGFIALSDTHVRKPHTLPNAVKYLRKHLLSLESPYILPHNITRSVLFILPI